MAIKYGFFNSVNGDRLYNADDFNRYFNAIVSSGVVPFPNASSFQVLVNSGMQIKVSAGKAFIDGHWVENDAYVYLTLDNADTVIPRTDSIILRLDNSARQITLAVKKGALTGLAPLPSLERSETIKEYAIADIKVQPKTTLISQSNITDTRGNSARCGWCAGLVTQKNTENFFVQWQSKYDEYYRKSTEEIDAYFTEKKAAFDSWFENLSAQLNVDTWIKEFTKSETVTEKTNVISLNISGYTYDAADLFFVTVNGFLLQKGVDYAINSSMSRIELTNDVEAGNIVGVRILKSVIGHADSNQ